MFMWSRMCPITRLSQVTANATPPPPSSAPYYPQASTGATAPDFFSIMTHIFQPTNLKLTSGFLVNMNPNGNMALCLESLGLGW